MINDCRSPGWTGKRLSPGNRTRQFGRVDKIVSVASKYLNLIQHTLSSYYHTHKSLLQTRPLAPHRKKITTRKSSLKKEKNSKSTCQNIPPCSEKWCDHNERATRGDWNRFSRAFFLAVTKANLAKELRLVIPSNVSGPRTIRKPQNHPHLKGETGPEREIAERGDHNSLWPILKSIQLNNYTLEGGFTRPKMDGSPKS